MDRESTVQRSRPGLNSSIVAQNRVLRNTYMLLSLSLLVSALTSGIALAQNVAPMSPLVTILVYLGLIFFIQFKRNSALGVVGVFALTAFLGWTLGPILNFYIKTFSNGPELIILALGSTGLIFVSLSAIAANPKRDFSNWISFLWIGALVAFVASLVNVFFLHMPIMYLVISIVFSIISGGYIMWQTNAIVRGGENNYVTATVILYVSIFNIFLTLLQLLGMFAGNRN